MLSVGSSLPLGWLKIVCNGVLFESFGALIDRLAPHDARTLSAFKFFLKEQIQKLKEISNDQVTDNRFLTFRSDKPENTSQLLTKLEKFIIQKYNNARTNIENQKKAISPKTNKK